MKNGKIKAYPKIAEAADVTRSNSGVYLYIGLPWFWIKLAKLPQMAVEKHNVTDIQNGPYKSGFPWRAYIANKFISQKYSWKWFCQTHFRPTFISDFLK